MSITIDKLDLFPEVDNQILDIRVDKVSSNEYILGAAELTNPATNSKCWLMKRVCGLNGELICQEYASKAFDQAWDNRDTIFNIFRNSTSALMDGVNDYVDLGDVADLDFDNTSAFSISVWFKSNYTGSVEKALFSKQGAGNTAGYRFTIESDMLKMHIVNGVSNRIEVGSGTLTINDNEWHHACVSYDGSNNAAGVSIFFDGVNQALVEAADSLGDSISNGVPAQYSGRNGTSNCFSGHMDEITVWNVALSAAETTELYNGAVPSDITEHSKIANNVGWWRHDGDVFPTIIDASPNTSNNGTMMNMSAGDLVSEVPS